MTLRLLLPADVAEPIELLDVCSGGPARDQVHPTGAHAVWDGGGSASWSSQRPFDWWRVVEVIDHLSAEPFDGDATSNSFVNIVVEDRAVDFVRHTYPALGVTLYHPQSLEATSVLVLPGDEPPSRLAWWEVPDQPDPFGPWPEGLTTSDA